MLARRANFRGLLKANFSTSSVLRILGEKPSSDYDLPLKEEKSKQLALQMSHGKQKTLASFIGEVQVKEDEQPLVMEGDTKEEIVLISGIPPEHREGRKARIHQPAKAASQTAWKNTGMWKIELDNRERWENPNIGWSSSADPLSNISMALDFASREDAINFCVKNHWEYELEETHERKMLPKQYGSNFSWNKRSRVSTK